MSPTLCYQQDFPGVVKAIGFHYFFLPKRSPQHSHPSEKSHSSITSWLFSSLLLCANVSYVVYLFVLITWHWGTQKEGKKPVCAAHRPGPDKENQGKDIAELVQARHKMRPPKIMPVWEVLRQVWDTKGQRSQTQLSIGGRQINEMCDWPG